MPGTPLVSVLIPTFNQPDLFRRALLSVCSQTYCDIEIVVSDDSTDERVEAVVRDIADQRVAYHRHPEPSGPAANWNNAMTLARGRYVKFLHHDDWFASEAALAALVDEALRSSASFVFCASTGVDAFGRTVVVNRASSAMVAELRSEPRSLIRHGNVIGAPSATMFRRDGRYRFDLGLQWLVDIDFYMSFLSGWRSLSYVDQVLVHTTTGSAHQVTADSARNPRVELPERDILLRRHMPGRRIARWAALSKLAHAYPGLSLQEVVAMNLTRDAKVCVAVGSASAHWRHKVRNYVRPPDDY